MIKTVIGSRHLLLIAALTSFIKNKFVEWGAPEDKIIVAPDAVDLSAFKNLPSPKECRRKFNLPEDVWLVGYIGRFESIGREKGVGILAEAVRQIPEVDGRKVMLLAVGGPLPMVEKYKNQQTIFFDHQPAEDVPYWIKACDVVTIPWQWTEFSAYYTSPLKLFEYMAADVPIIASDLPALREVLNENNAVLVKAGDREALVVAIEKLLKNPDLSSKIAEQAKADVQQYTWEKRAQKILKLIR